MATVLNDNVVGFVVSHDFDLADFLLEQVAGLLQNSLSLSNGSILCTVGLYKRQLVPGVDTIPAGTTTANQRIAGIQHVNTSFQRLLLTDEDQNKEEETLAG